jgi:two-component system sensor kinase
MALELISIYLSAFFPSLVEQIGTINENYFRLLILIIFIVIIALLAERIDKVRNLRNLNKQLEEKARELEEANEELESFAYSVSHDLRVPLRAIDGFSRILVEDYENELDDEGVRLLNIVRDNTAKMGQLIDDILLLSRAGRQEMNITEIDMKALAQSVYENIKTGIGDRQINIEFKNMPIAKADRALITQVYQNLIGNAVKFTSRTEDAKIEVGATETKDEVTYYVKDNGAGFDMKYMNKLFGLFQRLHSPEEFEGTGVGLSIVQRIIRRHGGKVWGEGEIDKGATIYFSLPSN